MKLQIDPRLPTSDSLQDLKRRITDLWRDLAGQVNGISEGAVAANYNSQTSVPTQGTYAQGDFIRNKTPSELGVAGSKYIITGWTCTVAGSPGTWLPNRTLTGN